MSSLPAERAGESVASDRAQPPPARGGRPSHWLQFLLIAGSVVMLDQISKRYVDSHLTLGESWPSESWPFRFMHVKNTGAAFSMLQNQTLFLTIMSLVGLAAIVLYFRYRPSDHPLLRIALALQLGGAVGNLIDRALYGHVTDFLKIPHWPVFNVADSAISVGVATVVVFLIFGGDGEAKQPAPAP
jgi:signal peptidase II